MVVLRQLHRRVNFCGLKRVLQRQKILSQPERTTAERIVGLFRKSLFKRGDCHIAGQRDTGRKNTVGHIVPVPFITVRHRSLHSFRGHTGQTG